MEYPICTQSVKEKKFRYSLSWKKVRTSIGNFGLLAYHTLILFSKIQKFYRVRELSKSNQTRYGLSHVSLERKTKRIFGIACLQKSSFFNRKFQLLRLFYFQKYKNFIGTRNCPKRTKLGMEYPMCTQSVKQKEFLVQLVQKKVRISIGNIYLFAYYTLILFSKIQKFYRVKELFKSNQTRYGVSHLYLERKRKKFRYSLPWKKVRISIGNFGVLAYYTLILFSKIQKFYRVKELFKSNQTRYGVSHLYLERKRKKFRYRLSLKKVRTSIGNFGLLAYHTLILFSKVQKFYRVKELFKSNQTRYGVSHLYLERKRKKISVQIVLEKSSFFNRKFRHIRLFYFQKYRNFIGSRNCSNRTKLGMEYPMCTQSVKEKNFGIACLGKKFVFQSEILAYSLIIRLFYFQKYRNFIGSRSCSNRTKLGMEYPICTQSVKEKKFRYRLSWKKVRTSIGNFGLLAYHTLILFSKVQKFYRVKELSKSNQTRLGVSHVSLERKTKRIFGIASLQKSSFFNRKFQLLRLFYFQKYKNFIGTRNCPKRTKLGMEYPMCTQRVKQKEFLVQLVQKKVRISIGNIDLFAYYTLILFSNIQNFYRVKELSKSYQTRYGVSRVYLERKTKRIFVIACLQKSSFFNRKFRHIRLFYFQKYRNFIGSRNCSNRTKLGMEYPMCTQSVKEKNFGIACFGKKFVFQSEILAYSLIIRLFYFQKYRYFYRVKELSKSNQTRYGVSHVYLEIKTKRIFGATCLEKSSYFNRKYRLLRLFYFQKYRNFIGTRNCPQRTKLGMEYPMCTQSVKQKEIWCSLSRKKFVFQSEISTYSLIIR